MPDLKMPDLKKFLTEAIEVIDKAIARAEQDPLVIKVGPGDLSGVEELAEEMEENKFEIVADWIKIDLEKKEISIDSLLETKKILQKMLSRLEGSGEASKTF